ncbi:hypothetical protein J437_LFUL013141 [Ladona fulva]|uniref:CUB domain-containing protein n=1 Tax=Ladona fulva TaxID=123851 RepID=A0A8K0P7L0_LADFU|nr:hypothetical protein J437_LFUL013141 [Ladona fulva]
MVMLSTFAPTNCNQVFSSDISKNGTISSPDYPNPYPARSQCRFDFQGRGKERVQITFTDFNLYHPEDNPKEWPRATRYFDLFIQAYFHGGLNFRLLLSPAGNSSANIFSPPSSVGFRDRVFSE